MGKLLMLFFEFLDNGNEVLVVGVVHFYNGVSFDKDVSEFLRADDNIVIS